MVPEEKVPFSRIPVPEYYAGAIQFNPYPEALFL
jgi:hypothetical protein